MARSGNPPVPPAGLIPAKGGRSDPLAPYLARAAEGDDHCLGIVLRQIAPAVLTVTRFLLGAGHPDVEDTAQESMLAILDAVGRFRGESSFLHYARRIATRIALNARRRHPSFVPLDQPAAELAGNDEPLSDRVQREQRAAAFRKLLNELPEVQAESIAMRVVLGHSLAQVAEATGAPVNTVRSRIRLAREQLRARIAADPSLAALFEVEE